MTRIAAFLPVLGFLCCPLHGAAQASPGSDTLFFEDFNGPSLDRSKWNVEVTGFTVNNEQEAYVDSSATLYISHGSEAQGASGGVLVIGACYSPGYITKQGKKFDLLSGRINTRNKAEFTYGKVSARMKLPAGPGFWPAFWMLGNGRWPQTGEIDIMENIGDSSWVSSAMHGPGYFGNTPLVKRNYFASPDDITGWHIYAVDWTKDSLVFSVDGDPRYTVTRDMVTKFGPWAFDNPKFLILNLALGGGYPEGVNHANTPYPGITPGTFERIKEGQGKVLVDWVLVTRVDTTAAH